jgi:hypothetical protein
MPKPKKSNQATVHEGMGVRGDKEIGAAELMARCAKKAGK